MRTGQHFINLKKDPLGEISYDAARIQRKIIQSLFTAYNRLKLRLQGVVLGTNNYFWGNTNIYRYPLSKIFIGNNCKFNSMSKYNFRGINHNCIIETGSPNAIIRIGNSCGFSGVSIVADMDVTIGDNVMIGANSIIGDRDDHPEKYLTFPKSVKIGDNVWIGMNCIILKGVSIGANSIIGAGSIVTKDIPQNCVAAGNPCKVIRYINI